MKQILLTALFSALIFTSSHAVVSLSSLSIPGETKIVEEPPDLLKSLAKMKVKDLEKIAGRKLSLKEKVGFYILKLRLKRQSNNETATDNGKTAFLLGLLSLLCLFVPFVNFASIFLAIIAIVIGNKELKQNPSNHKAKTGVILGWITIGLIVAALILIVALLSGFSIV